MSAAGMNFYTVGGTIRSDSPSYVERQADRDLYDGLLQGEFCYVLTSRQMGKSSLMVRTATRLRQQGMTVVVLDLTAVGQNLTPDQWYDGLGMSLGRQTRLEDELEDYWRANDRLSPVQRFVNGLREIVLAHQTGSVVIFVDEIDNVRSLPFSTDEFFAAIRECYNRRTEDGVFRRLTFCLLGVAAPTDLIRDTRITPFNIGRRIELNDFTVTEAAPLAQGLRQPAPGAGVLLERILYWTHGHPYLTQRLCRAVAENPTARAARDVDRVCEDLFLSSRARERDDNLLFVRERLLRSEGNRADLLSVYDSIRRGRRVPDDETSPLISVLRLAGIVRAEGGCLRERNRIYEHVFNAAWVRAHMPDQELHRQREAFWRGLMRGSAIVAASIAAGLILTSILRAHQETREIETAQRRLGEIYQGLSTYSDSLEMKEDVLYEGGARDTDSILIRGLRAEKPNKLSFEARIIRAGTINEIVVNSDGDRLSIELENSNRYRTLPAASDFTGLLRQISTALAAEGRDLTLDLTETIYPVILAAQPVRAIAGLARDVAFVRKAEVLGVQAYVFRWQESVPVPGQPGQEKLINVTNWVARNDGHFLQVEKDVTGLERRRPADPSFGRGERGFTRPRRILATNQQSLLTMRHVAVTLNPRLGTNDFIYDPPPAAELASSLTGRGRPGLGGPVGPDPRPPDVETRRIVVLIPARDRSLPGNLVDLSAYFTHPLTHLLERPGGTSQPNQLSAGTHIIQRVLFDLRGLVQPMLPRGFFGGGGRRPIRPVAEIQIGQAVRRIHFLNGASESTQDGIPIGAFLIHYEDGRQVSLPILHGVDVIDFLRAPTPEQLANGLPIPWIWPAPSGGTPMPALHFYTRAWENPRPEQVIARVDFFAGSEASQPLLLAITVE